MNKKTRIILLLTRITSFHVYVLERYDICIIRAIPALASHRTMHIRVFFIVSHSSCLVTWYACGQLKFNYRITNYAWLDAHNGIAELEKYPKHRRPIKVRLSYRECHVTGRAQWYCGTREVSKSIEPNASYRTAICARQDAHSRERTM